MPRIPVQQLRINMTVRKQPFLLREKSVSTTRTGSLMLRVLLADRTGPINGVLFDAPGYVIDSLIVGSGVEVSGRVDEYRGQIQMNLERIEAAELQNLEDFLPSSRRLLKEMVAEFDALRLSIQNFDLARLLDVLFDDEVFYKAFTTAPAAKFNHHACVGGLLEHTLAVAELVKTTAATTPEINLELALTAALLHDIGKIQSYNPVSFDLTKLGYLWGHLYISASIVERTIATMPDFDVELRDQLVHAILAHHGKLENGSPVKPMTLEAIALHRADDMDSAVRGALDELERTGEDSSAFTPYSNMQDGKLYRTPESDGGGKQGTLF